MRMRRVRQENTAPEMAVRRFLHARGLRYVLHCRALAGRPDLVFPRRRCVVFVHGCFWHGHDCRHGSVKAKTNQEYWKRKLDQNQARDKRQQRQLRASGWRVSVIWECETDDEATLAALASRLLRL